MIIKNIQARIYRMVYKCFNREQNATLEYEKLWLMLFSRPVISDSSQPHGPQHTRPPCSYTISWSLPKSMSLHQLYYPAISSSDALFSFCPQSFPASGTFPMSQLFVSGDQNTGTSASTWKQCEVCVLVTQSYLTLCDPTDCRPTGSSVMEFSRQEYWSSLPFSSPGDLPDPRIKPRSPALQADSLPSEPPGKSIELRNMLSKTNKGW